jgi:hypothetical protein
MLQLDGKGGVIIPLRIDQSPLPVGVVHVRAVDFTQWRKATEFAKAFQSLAMALGLEKAERLEFLENQIALSMYPELVASKECADGLVQLYFQLERLWFYLFERGFGRQSEARHWFTESARKSIAMGPVRLLATQLQRVSDLARTTRLHNVYEALMKLEADHEYFDGVSSGPDDDDVLFYERIWKAEDYARAISAMIRALIIDAQAGQSAEV